MVLAADQYLGTVTVTYHVTVSAPQARTSENTTYSVNPTKISQIRTATA
jgi:phosphoribosylformylglycinamidine (FGAM) synthase PurS component